ncbi:MAG TPA: hypothetical protein VER55_11825, partial [Ardenticatenaceae bacterium]|nr:hypothetical protein [Ardenticatenaceae bacterium]
CHRLPNNRFHAIGRPAFHLASTGDFEAAVRDGTRRILSEVESFIRATPEQWIVTVPLWRQWESAV